MRRRIEFHVVKLPLLLFRGTRGEFHRNRLCRAFCRQLLLRQTLWRHRRSADRGVQFNRGRRYCGGRSVGAAAVDGSGGRNRGTAIDGSIDGSINRRAIRSAGEVAHGIVASRGSSGAWRQVGGRGGVDGLSRWICRARGIHGTP